MHRVEYLLVHRGYDKAGLLSEFRHRVDKIGKLYNQKFGEEMKKSDQRMRMHTDRYTGNAKYTKSRKSRK